MDRLEFQALRDKVLALLQAEVPLNVQFALVLRSDELMMFGSSTPPEATRSLLLNAALSIPENVARR